MADKGLIIKIGAETKEFNDAVKDIKKQTEDLEGALGGIAKVSGVAFAGLIAAGGIAVKAFADAEKSSKALELALQNQGIASDELRAKYKEQADSLSKLTGVDDDAIKSGQAVLQTFLGQTEISQELAANMVDLAEKTGSVESAAELLGKAANGNVKALKQFGIEIDDNLTKEERLAQITEKVTQKFGGLAQSAGEGLGSFRGLETAVGNLVEGVGERLAPVVVEVTQKLTAFFQKLNDPAVLDFVVEVGKIAVVVTGVITGLATAAITLIKLQQAFAIAKAAMLAFGISAKVAIGATGIGLLLIVVGEIYAHWDTVFPAMQAIFQTFTENITNIGGALGKILSGIFSLNPSLIKQGIEEAKKIVVEGIENVKEAVAAGNEEQNTAQQAQDQKKLAQARATNAALEEEERRKQEVADAEAELALLKAQEASQALIDLKTKEVEVLKQLQEKQTAEQREALTKRAEELRAVQLEQASTDEVQRAVLNENILKQDAEYQAMSKAQQDAFLLANSQKLQASIKTDQQIRADAVRQRAEEQIAANNKFLEDQNKFGTAYASINKVMHGGQVEGAKQAFGALAQLQNSKNKELKAIGKAAAIGQITIQTGEAAMNAYSGFLKAIPFPPVAIPLGIAAAAATVAFGAEQIATVLSAQSGGIVPGVSMGGDSVPSILEPGELVVPRSNFSEVVNAVAAARAQTTPEASVGVGLGAGQTSAVSVDLRFSGDNAEKFLTARQVESRSLGTLRESTS